MKLHVVYRLKVFGRTHTKVVVRILFRFAYCVMVSFLVFVRSVKELEQTMDGSKKADDQTGPISGSKMTTSKVERTPHRIENATSSVPLRDCKVKNNTKDGKVVSKGIVSVAFGLA